MKNTITLLLTLFALTTAVSAQQLVANFSINLPAYKIQNSLYNKIDFIDSRIDVTNLGTVQTNESLLVTPVVPSVHLSTQLKNLLQAVVDSTAEHGELLFQLTKLRFQVEGAKNEFGYFFLKANLFSKTNRTYRTINSIDTSILVRQPEVAGTLLLNASAAIIQFVTSSLSLTPDDSTVYTLDDVLRIEMSEKDHELHDTGIALVDGVYFNHETFAKQKPDRKIEVKLKDGFISRIDIIDDKNKRVRMNPQEVYLMVYKNTIYIPTDYGGLYPLILK